MTTLLNKFGWLLWESPDRADRGVGALVLPRERKVSCPSRRK
jgi:hypothetical protein